MIDLPHMAVIAIILLAIVIYRIVKTAPVEQEFTYEEDGVVKTITALVGKTKIYIVNETVHWN